jgi:hypothetical protein
MTSGLVVRKPAERFAAWLDNNRNGLLVLSLLIALLGGYLASRMKIEASLTNLLPPQEQSVRDLAAIQARARPFGTVEILLESSDVALRARAGEALSRRLATLRPDLVAQLVTDDGDLSRYLWQHRFLWAELEDLSAARDALRERIQRAKLTANPLFISLEDEEAPGRDRLDELEAELGKLEQRAKRPELRVSQDGRLQLLVLQTTFSASDARRANLLIGAVKHAIEDTKHEVGRGVRYGLTGNITLAMYEHDSVLDGMTVAASVTVVLCAAGLMLYYGSGLVVLAILWALTVGVAATFAVAWAGIGHLNVMTAFLFAIVIGNGINAGMMFAARYLEELRAGSDARAALPVAFAGTLRGTLAAMATAAVAYTSLLITDFRGFQQFGAIAGVGMALTWLTAYTVLPALLLVMARRGLLNVTKAPSLGETLARLVPARSGYLRVLAIGALITAVALVISVRYIVRDPFTHDWRDLQSSTSSISRARAIDARIRAAFDNRAMLAGQAYQLVIAVDRRDQVAPLVAKLTADDQARAPDRRWIRDVKSVDDVLPPAQDAKLAVLRELDQLLADPQLQATLSDDERARLAKLRPPPELRPVTDADVPVALGWPFIERDGSRGRLIVVRGAARFNSFDVADRLEFAREVRALELPNGALVAGESLVVSDIIETMERDAPKIILFALGGSILTVLLVLGVRRHGMVTLACGVVGVLLMIAVCALLGLRVHFLDLIALPITIGIGIDYAVNLAARDRQEGECGPRHLVRTTGSTVLLCSYTTAVGYGTLMLSANGGIRSFGLAALVGEVACVTMALVVAPVCLAVLRDRASRLHGNSHSSVTTL